MRPEAWRPMFGALFGGRAGAWRRELLMPENGPSYLGLGAIGRILSPANWAWLPTTPWV